MTVNKDTVIDTIFVAEYDVSSKIGDQGNILGYKSGNSYGVCFNDSYWSRFHHMAQNLTYNEMIKQLAKGCKELITYKVVKGKMSNE